MVGFGSRPEGADRPQGDKEHAENFRGIRAASGTVVPVSPGLSRHPLPIDVEQIPQELRSTRQWVVHDGKRPLQPDAQSADSTSSSTWTGFNEVIEVLDEPSVPERRFDGVGMVLTEEDPYVVIDLDGVIDPETGELEP